MVRSSTSASPPKEQKNTLHPETAPAAAAWVCSRELACLSPSKYWSRAADRSDSSVHGNLEGDMGCAGSKPREPDPLTFTQPTATSPTPPSAAARPPPGSGSSPAPPLDARSIHVEARPPPVADTSADEALALQLARELESLCMDCEQRSARPGYQLCRECNELRRSQIRPQLCTECRRAMANPGYRWCQDCYEDYLDDQQEEGEEEEEETDRGSGGGFGMFNFNFGGFGGGGGGGGSAPAAVKAVSWREVAPTPGGPRADSLRLVRSRDIQTAVRLVMPGELAKHAVSEGTKAVTKFASGESQRIVGMPMAPSAGLRCDPELIAALAGVAPGARALLSDGAAVYAAAAIEYFLAELIELSANKCRGGSGSGSGSGSGPSVDSAHIADAIEGDEELSKMLQAGLVALRGAPFFRFSDDDPKPRSFGGGLSGFGSVSSATATASSTQPDDPYELWLLAKLEQVCSSAGELAVCESLLHTPPWIHLC